MRATEFITEAEQTPAQKYIQDVYSQYPDWPYGRADKVMVWGEGEAQQFAAFKLKPGPSPTIVEIDWLEAGPEQRQGVGSRAIKELQRQAQASGIKLKLVPWDKGRVSKASLTRLYKRHGFKPIGKDARSMEWEPVKEAFDQPYTMTWEHGEGSHDALVKLPDGTNLSIMFSYELGNPTRDPEDAWKVEFWRNNSVDVTGEGDAQKIFATVLSAIQQFIKQEHPDRIVFSASKNVEPNQNSQSRSKLYNRLVQRYANSWGYKTYIDDYDDSVVYILTNKNHQVDEGIGHWLAGIATVGAMMFGAPDAQALTQQQYDQTAHMLATAPAQILKKVAVASGITGHELAQFMAQCAHETAGFSTMKEQGGSLDFKKYDIKHNPRKAKSLGNVKPGDGARYHGRGYIQLTGRDNYKRAGQALGLPLEQRPELVEKPEVAAKVAVWFWKSRVQPKVDSYKDTRQVTKPINPGMRGLNDRQAKYDAIKAGAMARANQLAPRGTKI